MMDANGENRKQVSKVENGVGGFLFSPDETKVVLIGNVKYSRSAADLYPDLPKATGRVIDDMMYKHWDEWVTEIPHPFVADFNGSAITDPVDIMDGEPYESPMKPFGGVESFAWSTDSKNLVYVSRKKTGKEYAISTNSDLYLYNLEKKTTDNLTEGMMGYDTNPAFSPDGTKLAWLSMERDGYEADKNRLFVMDMASGQKTDITSEWDYTIESFAWNRDGASIWFLAYQDGGAPIFSVDLGSKTFSVFDKGDYDYSSVMPVSDDRVIATRHSFVRPDEIFSVTKGDAKQLTDVNGDIFSQI
ncbi:MAG: peptidase S9, partial [Muribaculaceae bacterium]|nr:peptidase S9 [Muribaculaceae bacterium]